MFKQYINIFLGVLTIVGTSIGIIIAFNNMIIGISILVGCLVLSLVIFLMKPTIETEVHHENNHVTRVYNGGRFYYICWGIITTSIHGICNVIMNKDLYVVGLSFILIFYIFALFRIFKFFRQNAFFEAIKKSFIVIVSFVISTLIMVSIIEVLESM